MTTMKAVMVHEYGGPEVLSYEDVPKPSLSEGDVLIRVEAAGVNPGEAKIRAGDFAEYHTLPFILGYDIAGTVIAETARGVVDAQVGDAVYANCDSTRNGGNAEFVAVRASEVAPRPRSLNAVQAASVPLSGLTAWQALADVAHLAPGQKVLVHGGGGAVGSFAVQFVKVMGGEVVATASGEDLEYVREIGADTVVDYKTQRFEELRQRGGCCAGHGRRRDRAAVPVCAEARRPDCYVLCAPRHKSRRGAWPANALHGSRAERRAAWANRRFD